MLFSPRNLNIAVTELCILVMKHGGIPADRMRADAKEEGAIAELDEVLSAAHLCGYIVTGESHQITPAGRAHVERTLKGIAERIAKRVFDEAKAKASAVFSSVRI